MRPLLELIDVTRRFPGVLALEGVSFDLRAGEVHALVGENGAGKSTLINIVSGVLAPDDGRVLLDGRPAALTDPVTARRKGVVAVHQEADLFETLSVAENMALARGLPTNAAGLVRWSEVYREAREAVASLGEKIDVRQPASRLSVAHRHMTQVAAAARQRARIVILDEPTSALTAVESRWLFDTIERLKRADVGIIYITHRQEEIFQLSDRITVLRDGRRVWTGATEDIDRPGLIHAMVGRQQATPREGRGSRIAPDRLGTPRLCVRGLTDEQDRFNRVSLESYGGEVVGVYGLVGSGRSEWAQAVFGLRPAVEGSVEIDGHLCGMRTAADAVKAGIAYLPEDRLRQGVFRGLSIRANTVLSSLRRFARGPLVSASMERTAVERLAAELDVRMQDVGQEIEQLSGGNQQKLVLARWLLSEPRVLILDEPTRGVDVGAKAEIHRLVRRLAEDGCAVVMISSELPEVMEHSDRIVVFRSGSVAGKFDPRSCTPAQVARAALPDEAPDLDELATRKGRRLPGARVPWNELGLLVGITILATFLVLTTQGRFATPENLLGIVGNASVWTILALGAAAVIIAGGIDISIGSLLALSAAGAGLVMKLPLAHAAAVPLGIATGLLVGAAGGAINAAVSVVGRIHPIVVTLGAMTVYRGLMITLTGGDTISELPPAFTGLATGRVLGVSGAVVVMLATVVVAYLWLGHTGSGRHLYAFGSSVTAARLAGISRTRVWLTAFGAGGLCAGLAGLVELAQNGSMQSVLGTGYELRAIAAAVIGGIAITGGRGSVGGVVLGALLLSLVQNALVLWQVSRFHYHVVIGGLLLTAILVDLGIRRIRR